MRFQKWLLYFFIFFFSCLCLGMEKRKHHFSVPTILRNEKQPTETLLCVSYDKPKQPIVFFKDEIGYSLVLNSCFDKNFDDSGDNAPLVLPISIKVLSVLQPMIKDFSQSHNSDWQRLMHEWQILLRGRFEYTREKERRRKHCKERRQLAFIKESSYLACPNIEKIFTKLLVKDLVKKVLHCPLSKISSLLTPYRDIPLEVSYRVGWELLKVIGVVAETRNRKNTYFYPNDNYSVDLFACNDNSLVLLHQKGSNNALLTNLKTKKIKRFYEHQKEIKALSFSPDGVLCATADNETIFIRSVNRDDPKPAFNEGASALLFNHDGSLLVSGNSNGGIAVWDIFLHEKYRTIDNDNAPITMLCFHPFKKMYLMVGDKNGKVNLWNIGKDKPYISKTKLLNKHITSISYQEQGELVALGTETDGTYILDAETFSCYKHLKQSDGWSGVACFGFGNCLAVATSNNAEVSNNHIEVWNLRKNKRIRIIEFAQCPTLAITFCKRRKKCIAISQEGSVNIYNFNKNEVEKALKYCNIEQAVVLTLIHDSIQNKKLINISPLQQYYASLPLVLKNYVDDSMMSLQVQENNDVCAAAKK